MNSKNMSDNFIRSYHTTRSNVKGCSFTKDNVSTTPIAKIGWTDIFRFWKDYCEKWTKDKNEFAATQIYEYNEEESTLRFTFNFEFSDKKSVVEDTEIESILSIIKDSIFDKLIIDGETLACVSFSHGNQFFILDYNFPSIRIGKDIFNKSIVPDICDRLRNSGIRKDLPDFLKDWDTIISKSTNFSPLFGCKASKDNPPLEIIGVWSSDVTRCEDDIRDNFSASKYSVFTKHCSKIIKNLDEENIDYTPVFYSSQFYEKITHQKVEESKSTFSFVSEISSSEEQDMIHHLLPLINKNKFESIMYRWQIGRCIYNIFKKEKAGLEFWETYCPEYKEFIHKCWNEDFPNDIGINDYLSIKTIGYFAKIDNPDGYESWHNSWMEEALNESFKMIEINVSEVMYRLLWLDFLTVGKNEWYYFTMRGNKLNKSASNVEFRKRFTDLIRYYAKVLSDYPTSISHKDDPDKEKIKDADKIKSIPDIIKKLGTIAYQNAIEKHCFIKFYRENIEKFFDTNPCLISWGNMVSEVRENYIFDREGKMEDFLTRGSDICYEKDKYTWDSPAIKELLYWFKTAFVDPVLVDCFLKIACSFMYGRNKEKRFYAFCGPSGDNSKSMMDKLFKGVFSIHAIDFPLNVLTDSKQSSGGPTPELAQAQNARYAGLPEADGKIPLQASLIKRYSGGDTFFARKCNQDGQSIEPMFKMVIYCNAVPPIDGADEAVERRLFIVPFESKYCDDAPETEEEQFKKRRFPKDPLFEEKVKTYRRPMLWILMNYFDRYMTEGIPRPKSVVEYTTKYWEENDPYKLFVSENILKTGSDGDKLAVTNVYKIFKIWYSTNFDVKKSGLPDIAAVTRHLSVSSLLGEYHCRVWSGVRINGGSNNDSGGMKRHKID